jgi:arsenite methyltransferase
VENVKPDYGIDAPPVVRGMIVNGAVLMAAGAIARYLITRSSLGSSLWSAGLFSGVSLWASAAYMVYCSKVAKFRLRDQLLDGLQWRGDEKVLDVGCGRGLALIGAAKRLTTGEAAGIDIWNASDLTDNTVMHTMANARLEGVVEKIEVRTGDARDNPYPNAYFDKVVSMTALHNINNWDGRDKALLEILRVLKRGGTFAIFDILYAGRYANILREAGAEVRVSSLTWLWLMPGRCIWGVKK